MAERQPLFSIIIPTYNRPGPLAVCLEACARLDFPREQLEVVVVDDGSPQALEPVVAAFHPRLSVLLVTQPNQGPGPARNTGAARARGRFLAFTDDDCTPAADWLQALAARLGSVPGCSVGGEVVNNLPDNLYCVASQIVVDVLCTRLNLQPDRAGFFTSNNLAVPADRFCALGGFYAHFAEDRDFTDRWVSQGYPMIYAPEAVVHHAHGLNFRSFLRLHYVYGRGAFRYHQARARRTGGRFRFEPFSSLLLLRYPLWQTWGWKAGWIGALLLLSKLTNAFGFFGEAAGYLAARASSRVQARLRRSTGDESQA